MSVVNVFQRAEHNLEEKRLCRTFSHSVADNFERLRHSSALFSNLYAHIDEQLGGQGERRLSFFPR